MLLENKVGLSQRNSTLRQWNQTHFCLYNTWSQTRCRTTWIMCTLMDISLKMPQALTLGQIRTGRGSDVLLHHVSQTKSWNFIHLNFLITRLLLKADIFFTSFTLFTLTSCPFISMGNPESMPNSNILAAASRACLQQTEILTSLNFAHLTVKIPLIQ